MLLLRKLSFLLVVASGFSAVEVAASAASAGTARPRYHGHGLEYALIRHLIYYRHEFPPHLTEDGGERLGARLPPRLHLRADPVRQVPDLTIPLVVVPTFLQGHLLLLPLSAAAAWPVGK